MSNECPICITEYNDSTRSPVRCPDPECEYTVCRSCLKYYITQNNFDPKCMECSKVYPRTYLQSSMPQTWLAKDFKNSRKTTLVERQKAMIPETMPHIEQKKTLDQYKKQMQEHQVAIVKKLDEVRQLREEQAALSEIVQRMQNGELVASNKQKKKHTIKCPNCPAFLNEDHICPSCDTRICKHCHDIIQLDAKVVKPVENGDGSEPTDVLEPVEKAKHLIHRCNPDTLKTIQQLKQDSKPCPKCGIITFKISGCNQMWCTECHATWDWKSGKIVTGIIHNPHYFQYMNQHGGGMPRQPGDVPCGGLPGFRTIQETICWVPDDYRLEELGKMVSANKYNQLTYDRTESSGHSIVETVKNRIVFSKVYQLVGHINAIELPKYRMNMSEESTRLLRMEYIEQKLTDETFGKSLFEKERRCEKSTEILHVLETFVNVATDILQKMVRELSPLNKHRGKPKYEKYFITLSELFGFTEEILINTKKHTFANKGMENITAWWLTEPRSYRNKVARPLVQACYPSGSDKAWRAVYPEEHKVFRPEIILPYFNELRELEKYCNEEFEKISKAYKLVTPKITILSADIVNKKY